MVERADGTPTSRRVTASAAHVNGRPVGTPESPDVDGDPKPKNADIPPIALGDGCAAGRTAATGWDVSVTLGADSVDSDATAPVEPPETTADGRCSRAESLVRRADAGSPSRWRPSLPKTAVEPVAPVVDLGPDDRLGASAPLAAPVEPKADSVPPAAGSSGDAEPRASGNVRDLPNEEGFDGVGALVRAEVEIPDRDSGWSWASPVWLPPPPAEATAGVQPIQTPMPRATANAPTLPTCTALLVGAA
jgi:hypothetical protein